MSWCAHEMCRCVAWSRVLGVFWRVGMGKWTCFVFSSGYFTAPRWLEGTVRLTACSCGKNAGPIPARRVLFYFNLQISNLPSKVCGRE